MAREIKLSRRDEHNRDNWANLSSIAENTVKTVNNTHHVSQQLEALALDVKRIADALDELLRQRR